jgi:hypothetical protein
LGSEVKRSEVGELKVGGWRIQGQKLDVRDWEHCIPEESYHKEPDLTKGSVESNQVIDLIFKLCSIHGREVAYKQDKPVGG